MPRAGTGPDFIEALARGLDVITAFRPGRPVMTLAEVAAATDLARPTARRILLTLEKLGHVRSDGRLFSLTPRVLTLGWAYLSSLDLWEVAQPLMEDLVEKTHESTSAATLDLPDNVTAGRWGSLVLCEDGGGDNYLRGLTPRGALFDIALNRIEGQESEEFAGATFSPRHRTLFVNIQSSRGLTFAIRGPWHRGGF